MSKDRTDREQELANLVMNLSRIDSIDLIVAFLQLRPHLIEEAKEKLNGRDEA